MERRTERLVKQIEDLTRIANEAQADVVKDMSEGILSSWTSDKLEEAIINRVAANDLMRLVEAIEKEGEGQWEVFLKSLEWGILTDVKSEITNEADKRRAKVRRVILNTLLWIDHLTLKEVSSFLFSISR